MSLLYDEGQLLIATESRRVLEARVDVATLLPLLETQGRFHTEKILGLPQDHRPDKGVPFNEIPA